MPLGSATKTTISIDFTRAQGTNSSGKITFIPPRIVVGTTVLSTRPVAALIEDGVGEISLVRLPAGTYHVVEEIDNTEPYEWDFALPVSSPSTLQYEEIAAVAPVPAIYTYVKSVNGVIPNPNTGNVTITAEAGPHTHVSGDITNFAAAVDARIALVVDAAPASLDTLNELAAALGDDPNFAATITAALGGKINASIVDAAGDLLIGTAPDVVGRLAIGANGKILGVSGGALSWVDPPSSGGLRARVSTGNIQANFLAGEEGPWKPFPIAFRPPGIVASAGDVLDIDPSVLLGSGVATGSAEFDLASINNTDPNNPVILRCLSSGTNTPDQEGWGGFYCWNEQARRLPGYRDWVVQAGDIVGGTVTLCYLYRDPTAGSGSGLRVGRTDAFLQSNVSVRNWGSPTG